MRALLAMLVGLGQVAGPWLCCCGPACAATPRVAAAAEVCPHCAKSKPPTKPALPEPCPCGGKAAEPAPKPDPAADFAPAPVAVVAPAAGPAAVLSASPAAGTRRPFLPPGTRQSVHHVRC